MNSAQSVSVSKDALQNEARVLAISLADALAASSLSEKEKAAWATLLPEMRLDQLSRFAAVLDASVSQSAKAELAETMTKIKAITEKYAAMQAQADHDFMQGVAGMVEQLRTAEQALP